MRILLWIIALVPFLSLKAQTRLPVSSLNYTQWLPLPGYHPSADSSNPDQKWQFSKYAGISAGAGFFPGGSTTFLSAPVGLQVTRQLTNNLFAFAGISATPVFFSCRRLYTDPLLNQSYPGSILSNAYSPGMNLGASMGLMYINDAKTFSISGSIGVERSSYPVYPSGRMITKKQ